MKNAEIDNVDAPSCPTMLTVWSNEVPYAADYWGADNAPGTTPFMSSKEAAHYIGVSPYILKQLRTSPLDGEQGPPFIQLGKRVYYFRRGVELWVQQTFQAKAKSA